MDIRYKREMNHNYMIITIGEIAEVGYETSMLAVNQIEGLLKFRIRRGEDKKEYYYEITSHQPLSRLLERKHIKGEEIRKLLMGLSAALNRIEVYLLKEEQILLEPEYIYIEPDTFTSELCMVPGYTCDFPKQLTLLLQYLLEKVDHQDKEGVVLAYNLYHQSLKENYGMADLLRLLSPELPSGKRSGEYGNMENLPFPDSEDADYPLRETLKTEAETKDGVVQERYSLSKPGVEKGETKKRQDKKNKLLNKQNEKETPWGKIIFLTVGAEIAVWLLAGEEILFQYGFLTGAVLFAACILIFRLNRRTQPAKNDNMRENESKEAEQDAWSLIIEEETAEKESEEAIFNSRTEKNKKTEIETELLTENRRGDKLAILESLNRERESIEIPYVPFVIGKHEELADYCLHSPTVSRLHLRLDQKEGVFIITDLNSTNGTMVEGYQLQSNETVSIKNGDRICLADVEFRFWEDKMTYN